MFESWSKVTQILLVLLFNGQESPFGEYGKEAGFKSQCGGWGAEHRLARPSPDSLGGVCPAVTETAPSSPASTLWVRPVRQWLGPSDVE